MVNWLTILCNIFSVHDLGLYCSTKKKYRRMFLINYLFAYFTENDAVQSNQPPVSLPDVKQCDSKTENCDHDSEFEQPNGKHSLCCIGFSPCTNYTA